MEKNTFWMSANKDKGDIFRDTLVWAGFKHVKEPKDAYFALIDYESHRTSKILKKFENRVFIYPHSAMSFLLWDGLYQPNKHVLANFVPGFGQKQVMKAYGYPHPVIICGWPWGEILPRRKKQPINRVLFAPRHPNAPHFLLDSERKKDNSRAMRLLSEIANISIKIRHYGPLEASGITLVPHNVTLEPANLTIESARQSILDSDLVVANDTFAYLALSLGLPVLMFQESTPRNIAKHVNSFNLYKDIMEYPLDLFKHVKYRWLGGDIYDNINVANWIDRFIGEPFDRTIFLDTIQSKLGL